MRWRLCSIILLALLTHPVLYEKRFAMIGNAWLSPSTGNWQDETPKNPRLSPMATYILKLLKQ
jgi:hypothetical protein